MEEWQKQFKQLAFTFQEVFECPVCFSTMDSTLKQCLNGHGVCNSCASKIKKCPICQQEFVLLQKNILLDKILGNIPKLCPYTDKGCNTVVLDLEHQTYCGYRPTECKRASCCWKGCVKDLLEHVRECVNSKGKDVCEVTLNVEVPGIYVFGVNKTIACVTPIVFQNNVFWKYCFRNCITKCIYHKLYQIPTFKQTCNYYLVISFKKGDIKFEHSCKATADLDDKNGNDDIKSGLIIPDCELKRFLVPASENMYEYTLKLVKVDIS